MFGLLAAILFLSIRFGWETTASTTVSPSLHQCAAFLGKPWSWSRPDWVPSLEVIEKSRITWEQSGPQLPDSNLSAVWVPFVTLTLLIWGLCPRLLLLAWIHDQILPAEYDDGRKYDRKKQIAVLGHANSG